nr:hypothetical protein Itr_chr11CG25350 [Ipomoea trifida]
MYSTLPISLTQLNKMQVKIWVGTKLARQRRACHIISPSQVFLKLSK